MTLFQHKLTATLCLAMLLAACGEQAPDGGSTPPVREAWTFINYWAKWCKPCIKEIPELNALHALPDYEVLGVNYDGVTGEELQAQIDALGVAFPTLDRDPAEEFGIERPQVLPTTLVVRPDGRLKTILIGPQTEASLIAATLSVADARRRDPGQASAAAPAH